MLFIFYSSFLSFVGVTALNVNDHHGIIRVNAVPNSFCGLFETFPPVKFVEGGAKDGIEEGTFAWALGTNNRDGMV